MGMLKDFAKALGKGAGEPPKKAKKKAAKKAAVGNSVEFWKVPPATKVYRLPAEHEATVYTYDGTPLKGIPTGQRFVMTAVAGDVTMTSPYTGATTSTGDFDNVAYAYNGYIFGMASSHASAVRKLLRNGYQVEVEAYITGYNGEHGYPYVKGLFGFVDDGVFDGLK